MIRTKVLPLSVACVTVIALDTRGATPATAFFLGNSLTAGATGSGAVKNLAAARGIDLTYGWQINFGSTLKYIYDNPHGASGGLSSYGYWDTALLGNTWDAVTLQTWGDTLADNKTSIAGLITATRNNPNNQNTKIYIFDNWCQEHQPTDYSVQWLRSYDLSEPSTTQRRIDTWTRDYSDELMDQLNSPAFNSPVDIKRIPTGEVFYQLDQLAQNGQLPGVAGVEQWYLDPWHVGTEGNYVGSLTFFATLYAQDPTGLPVPAGMDPQVAATIQQTVWNVVTNDPYTDVPQQRAWVNTSSVDNQWNRSANWAGGIVPEATSDISCELAAAYTVSITPNSNARVMKVNAGSATLALNGNTLALSSDLMIKSTGALTISGTGNLNVAGSAFVGCTVAGPSGDGTLNIAGGNVVISGALIVWGTTATSLNLSGGSLSTPMLTIRSGGQFNYNGGSASIANVQLSGSGVLKLSAGRNKTLKLTTLSASETSKLDLTDNMLIITGMPRGSLDGTTYTGVTGLIQSGHNGGRWNGSGIVTGMTNAVGGGRIMSIGVASASELGRVGEIFGGAMLGNADVLVMYTYGGDADLSGAINADDYAQIDFNWAIGGILPGWFNGDFDYSGSVDADDYGIIDFVWPIQGALFPTGAGINLATVPEPAGMGLLALGAAQLLRRKRRCA